MKGSFFVRHKVAIIWAIVIIFGVSIAFWSIMGYLTPVRKKKASQYKPEPEDYAAVFSMDGTLTSANYWIRPSDLENNVNSLISQYKQFGYAVDDLFNEPTLRIRTLKGMINSNLIQYIGVKNHFEIDEKTVEQRVDAIVNKYFKDPKQKQAILSKFGTEKRFREELTRDVRTSILHDKVVNALAPVTEEDMKTYFEKNIQEIKEKYEKAKAKHILVDKKEDAEKILKELKDKKTFDALAKEYSMDTATKNNGGELGWFTHGQMAKPFEDAVFKAEKDNVVGPVKTQFGWHVIKVEDLLKLDTFDELKAATSVYSEISKQLQNEKFSKFLDDYKKKHNFSYEIMDGVLVLWDEYLKLTDATEINYDALEDIKDKIGNMIYVDQSKKAIADDADDRLLALYTNVLNLLEKHYSAQKEDIDKYRILTLTIPATMKSADIPTLEKSVKDIEKKMENASTNTRNELDMKKLSLESGIKYLNLKEEFSKKGITLDKAADYSRNLQKEEKEVKDEYKIVLETLYKKAPYSSVVLSKLHALEPNNKEVTVKYYENRFEQIKSYVSNENTYNYLKSQIDPILSEIKSNLDSIAQDTAAATKTRLSAYEVLVYIDETMNNSYAILSDLQKIKMISPNYPDIDKKIKAAEHDIEMIESVRATETAVSTPSTTETTTLKSATSATATSK